jgi:membrane-associated phospholipid phosphatase
MNTQPKATKATSDRKDSQVKRLAGDFVSDQKDLWTAPRHLRFSDTIWLLPVSGITAGLFITDADYAHSLIRNTSPSTISRYNTLSNAGIAGLLGGAGAMWALSYKNHNDHWRETGFLAGEAAVSSLVMVEAMKYSFGRQRPNQGNGDGNFFAGGTSFPSEHSAAAFAVAGVIAHEYPGTLTKILAYGAATAVMYSRVHSLNHFRSDVFVGGLIGNLAAAQIYRKRHDVELGGESWETMSDAARDSVREPSPPNRGTPYVPLDSWVYPAFDRLAALGLIDSGFADMRPWTRSECARLLSEASERVEEGIGRPEAEPTYRLLQTEFRDELEGPGSGEDVRARLESLYTRVTGISGEPLTDGYHFGQTIINDYGRPFQEGLSTADGFAGWTAYGPGVAYVRAEYQYAPSGPALPESMRQFIYSRNNLPSVPPATPLAGTSSFHLLDAYAGMTFANWEITFGPQSLWWGPSLGGPLMFNDDARPVNMFRVNRVSPFKLPSFLGWVGPVRLEWFLGQLSGHEFVYQLDTGFVGQYGSNLGRQPFVQGLRFSLKPTKDFELGFSATSVFAGGPTPLTFHNLLKSYSIGNGNGIPGSASDPGDRRSGLDFSLRVPGLRNWLTIYTEAFVEDEFSPIAYWRNSAIWTGLYLPRIPKLPKMDLRVESGYTDLPGNLETGASDSHYGPGIFYSNSRYPNGYTNDGYLLGNWMGRQSQGTEAWSTYHLSPRNRIQVHYRHQKVSQQWMPGGATINDVSIGSEYWFHQRWNVNASVQYEKWKYPLLAPGPQTNIATSIGVTFAPFGGRL